MNLRYGSPSPSSDTALLEDTLLNSQFLEKFDLGYVPVDRSRVEAAVTALLTSVGEDVEREGLVDTPRRVARAYEEVLAGYRTDPMALLNNALFDMEYNDMVVVATIEFDSLCEHHLLPFPGHAHVASISHRTKLSACLRFHALLICSREDFSFRNA